MNERRRHQAETSEQQQQERQEKLSEAMSLLERGIEGILDSEGFANYLRTMARFHTYSFNNVALIVAQRPEATRVAGYKAWQALGRQVQKGEKGLIVFVPHRKRVRESPDENKEQQPAGEPDTQTTHLITGFGLGRVFDIAQTEGEPLPEPPAAQALNGESETGTQVDRRLSRFLIEEGVRLTVEDTDHANGYYRPADRLIALSDSLTGDQRTKTLVHEAAHYLADHRGQVTREDAETVAESSAFVVLAHYGIDAGSYSFPYVARWAKDKAVLKRNLAEVQGVAAGLIEGIDAAGLEEYDVRDGLRSGRGRCSLLA